MTHNINAIRAKAYDLLQELIDTTEFDQFLSGQMSFSDWLHYAKHSRMSGDRELSLIPEHIAVSCGCTRIVFWDLNTCDYVFKLNIYPNDIDYGASEVFIYNRACDEGLEECFAWTTKIIDDAKFPIYAMSYCEVDNAAMSDACYRYRFQATCEAEGYDPESLTEDEREEVENYISDYADTEGMLDFASSYYDYGVYSRLYDFLEEYQVHDLHCGNWGYYNGKLVITDYAGYQRDLVALAQERAA